MEPIIQGSSRMVHEPIQGSSIMSKRLDYINTRVQYIPIEWTISPYYWTNRSNNYWVQWNGPSVGPEEWT